MNCVVSRRLASRQGADSPSTNLDNIHVRAESLYRTRLQKNMQLTIMYLLPVCRSFLGDRWVGYKGREGGIRSTTDTSHVIYLLLPYRNSEKQKAVLRDLDSEHKKSKKIVESLSSAVEQKEVRAYIHA